MMVGVISDTHGHLNRAIASTFQGVSHIIHAGDVGSAAVLEALRRLAPVTAVRGNTDEGWAKQLPPTDLIMLDQTSFYILHDLNQLDLEPTAAGVQVVVSGHTHRPEARSAQGVLYFNPGSAAFGRQGTPPSIGIIRVIAGVPHPEIIPLPLL